MPPRRRSRLEWLAQVSAVLVPAALFALFAGNAWDSNWREAGRELERSADTVAEYARRVLDGHALRLQRANDLFVGLDDRRIEAEEARLHAALARITGPTTGPAMTQSIFVFDARSHLVASATVYPVPRGLDLSDREFNQALRDPSVPEPWLSSVQVGRLAPRAFFAINSRRAPSGTLPPGAYEGVLNVSIYVDEATAELHRLAAEPDDMVSLIRRDGQVLAGAGPDAEAPGSPRLAPAGPMGRGEPRLLAASASPLDAERRLVAYRAVEGWPAYVAVARPRSAIIARWQERAILQGAIALAAAAALLALGEAGIRRRRAADAESAALAVANQALERRVAERTVALAEERRRAEADAAERSAILAQLAEGVIVADQAGRVTFVNDAAARIHGAAHLGVGPDHFAEAYGLRTEDGRPYPPADLALARAALQGEVVAEQRWRIDRPDGAEVLASGSARPLRDAEGRQIGAVLTLRDETARDLAERALATREAAYRAIFETAAAGVTEIDVATNRYIRVNRRFCELVGRRPEEIEGILGPDDVAHPEDRGIAVSRRAAMSPDGSHEADKRYRRPDGTSLWVRVNAAVSARDAQGRALRTVAVVQDVTERRAAEHRQALLVAELNHRVKNVLATVQAIAGQTLRGTGGDPRHFVADFTGRLSVLARAHDLLTANAWQAADIGVLARAALAPWIGSEGAPRVMLTGLDGIRVGPRQAQALVLAMHELATNAAKHGALSRPGGSVVLGGMPAPDDALRLAWVESGGPPPQRPAIPPWVRHAAAGTRPGR